MKVNVLRATLLAVGFFGVLAFAQQPAPTQPVAPAIPALDEATQKQFVPLMQKRKELQQRYIQLLRESAEVDTEWYAIEGPALKNAHLLYVEYMVDPATGTSFVPRQTPQQQQAQQSKR